MTRNEMREQAFLLTFETFFNTDEEPDKLIETYSENVCEVCDYAKDVSKGVAEHREEFDDILNEYSKTWKVSRLPKVTLAIFYVALYEMEYVESVPEGVAINEAVNLAKKYAYPEDASYINGVLGAYLRNK